MASNYFYRRGHAEHGPVSFRELVALVCDGTLSRDDGVRPEWEAQWLRAEQIVGLFRMASVSAEPLAAPLACEQAAGAEGDAAAPAIETPVAAAEATESPAVPAPGVLDAAAGESIEPSAIPTWQARLRELARRPGRWVAPRSRRRPPAVEAAASFQDAVAEALDHVERSAARRSRPAWRERFNRLAASGTAHQVFRWGAALAIANGAALALLQWAEIEAIRFPPHGGAMTGAVLPILGPVSSTLFSAALLAAMACGGLAGYGGARLIELLADD